MELHQEVLDQARDLIEVFGNYDRVRAALRSRRSNRDEVAYAIATTLGVADVTNTTSALKHLYCYAPGKPNVPRVRIVEKFASGKHVRLFRGELVEQDAAGIMRKREVAVKWYGRHDDENSTKTEIDVYNKLYDSELPEEAVRLGLPKRCALPEFSRMYYLWGAPVLVLQWLQPLELGYEHEADIIPQVIRQLVHLHTFGVHSDLKPGNIMKRGNKYFVIDYGGVAQELQKDGSFHRWTWTKNWTSQARGERRVYTKNDLLELANTACTIQKARRGIKDKNSREGFHGRLKRFVEMVNNMKEYLCWKDYVALIELYEGDRDREKKEKHARRERDRHGKRSREGDKHGKKHRHD